MGDNGVAFGKKNEHFYDFHFFLFYFIPFHFALLNVTSVPSISPAEFFPIFFLHHSKQQK